MFLTLHCAEKEVQIEIGIVPQAAIDAVSDFKKNEVEIAIVSKDRAFTFVSYCTREELEQFLGHGEQIIDELDRQEAERLLRSVNRD